MMIKYIIHLYAQRVYYIGINKHRNNTEKKGAAEAGREKVMKRCMTDAEIESMVETMNTAFNEYFESETNEDRISDLISVICTLVKNDTQRHMDLNLEYSLYGGYTKSLVSNWSNHHPVRRDALKTLIPDETIKLAIEKKFITIPRYKGFSEYQYELVKLTAKGQRHVLKALAN